MTVRGGEECCSMYMAMCSPPRVYEGQQGAGLQEGAILGLLLSQIKHDTFRCESCKSWCISPSHLYSLLEVKYTSNHYNYVFSTYLSHK